MKQKELAKTLMMISNWQKKPFSLHVLYKNICIASVNEPSLISSEIY